MSLAALEPAPLIAAPPSDMIDAIVFPKPISSARTFHKLAYGMTILEILRELKIHPSMRLMIELDGVLVPRRHWAFKRPRPSQVLAIGVIPMGAGGGAGQDRNKALRTTLLAVVAIAALVIIAATAGTGTPVVAGGVITWGGVYGAIAATALTVGGGLLING